MPHHVLHPSHLLWGWLIFIRFPQICIIPTYIIRVYLKKDFLFWCSFSAFNENFPQCPALICEMVPPHSSKIFVYANSFEKLPQNLCPLCILFICIHLLYQCTNLKFPHLPFGCQNPSSWKMSLLRSSLYTIWQNITMSTYFSEFAQFS